MTAPSQTTTVAPGPIADVVSRLRLTHDGGRPRSAEWRDGQLAALDRLLVEREPELVEALIADLRRTPFDSLMYDLASTRAEIRHARKHLHAWMRSRAVPAPLAVRPGRAWFRYEPQGVVLIIGAWNYPVHLTLAPLVGALAAGNCVVIKPSEIAAATSAALARLVPQYLDRDAIAVVEGDAATTQELIGQRFDHCFFTGSPAVGVAVMAAAAEHLTPVTLELGGKCPVIVTRSARLDVAARRVAAGKMANSGQTCVAPDYVLVDEPVKDEFVQLVGEALRTFSEGREVPLINSRHAARVEQLIRTSGGKITAGGTVDVGTATAQLTVIVDPRPDSAVLAEEIFGPILPVVGVPSLGDAVRRIRQGPRPLASYLFSDDRSEEETVLEGIDTGAVVVNQVMHHLAANELPFGGTGNSGMGRYHGRWGFETFSYAKAVLRKPSAIDPRIAYPPYSRLTQRILRRLM